ncbi:MAG: DegT/DnrJ/EryC1/StrS family aminotransferase [Acidobacteriaceae bacterium]|nr:DegT/DnrJ/EryC1/StrS family aminotransferase [Acidobacteriaceae bacterium]
MRLMTAEEVIADRSVPFFCYPDVFARHADQYLDIIKNIGLRGAYILQDDLARFESNLAVFLGAKHSLGVANATDGLHLALRAAGLRAGDEVILSSHTMIATAAAAHFAGGVPVPVECGSDHLIDPDAIAAAITPRTRFIMPTQLNGRTCRMDRIQALAERHDLVIVEDAAQALGSRFKGRAAGTFGIAAAISFYPAKVLGCLGDGGTVVTSDDSMREKLLQLRDHGRASTGDIVSWGLNSRLDNLQAAILDFQLARYGEVMARRRAIAASYTEYLAEVDEVTLPPAPDSDPDHFDIYQNYEIEAERRDDLKQFLRDRGIGTLIQWGGQAIHQLKALGFTQSLPYTDRLFERLLMLPMNLSLSDDDVCYIAEQIRRFYGN